MTLASEDLGCGFGYRDELASDIWRHRTEIDVLEIVTESAFHSERISELEKIASEIPVVCHGLGMSLGSAEPLDPSYLDNVEQVLRRLRPRVFSDHLAITHIDGIDIGHLSPVCFDEETLEIVIGKIKLLKNRIRTPFLLENITYYFAFPGGTMPEWEFLDRVVREADCGLLLDLNNLYANSCNHHYDPYDFLRRIPLERVGQVHLAGSTTKNGVVIDSHGHSVGREVFDYLDFIWNRAPQPAVVIERDQNMPPFRELLDELNHARRVIGARARRA